MVQKKLLYIIFVCLSFLYLSCQLKADLLPSWNEGKAKSAILKFVNQVTQPGSEHFIPLEERIAAFDQDGTLWVEQPIYTEWFFAIDSIRSQASQHPEWRNKEPFKSIIEGNPEKLMRFSEQDAAQLIAITHSGMTVKAFQEKIADWLASALHPRFKKPFTQLVYQPMIELIDLLHEHGFKVYIVSGGGQEFIRAFAENIYGIPNERVIGSAGKVKYEYQKNGEPVLLKLPEVLFIDNKTGKPEGMNLIIGKRPIAAFGNSTGDQQMLEWTQASTRKNLELLVHHDDAEREYAYGPHSPIGTFSNALMNEAQERDWIIVSMKKDWKIIFPWQKEMHSENR